MKFTLSGGAAISPEVQVGLDVPKGLYSFMLICSKC